VIGNSMGGYIAAWLAATYPDRIASVALIDPAGVTAPRPATWNATWPRAQPVPDQLPGRIQILLCDDHGLAAVGAALVLDAIAHRYQRHVMNWKKSSATFAPAHRWSRNWPGKCPALLLWGRKDRLIDVSSVPVWSKGIANLRVEVWDGVGHMPMVEQPGNTARLYREFLGNQR
jgi:pimeloyl-ACP methyl ester carboxylesterase